jgi:aldose sugar dehydrogenase
MRVSILVAAMAVAICVRAADAAPEPVRGPPPPPQPAKLIKTGYKVTEIAKGLDHPWSMAFLPDGSI